MSGRPCLSAPPQGWPADNPPGQRPVRRWRVLHACEDGAVVAGVADAEIQAGMRPSVMTPHGWYRPGAAEQERPSALSLVHTWQEVRTWRSRYAADAVETWAEVLHAHCFAAAMAGLRGNVAVVYDLAAPIGAGITPRPGTWLLHSLRIAEQFAISRADAIVVHSHAAWLHALRHGGSADDLFLVLQPAEIGDWEAPPQRGDLVIFAPDVFADAEKGRESLVIVLRAFAIIATEIENVRLKLEAAGGAADTAREEVRKARLSDLVEITAPAQRKWSMTAAHVVITGRPAGDEPSAAMRSAFAQGRPVVAADVAQNREVTPQGRGCLWYRPDDFRDLARRAAFLARNRDFRAALGSSARQYLHSTCGAIAIARKYDEVYRHAFQRRRRGPDDALRKLEIAQAHW